MKNFFLVAIVFLTGFVQLSATTNPNVDAIQVLEVEKAVVLDLSSLAGTPELLTITNTDGELIFMDRIESGKQRIKYDLTNLPNDNYTIVVKGDRFADYYSANITNEAVRLESAETHARPEVSGSKETVFVNANFLTTESINITILDSFGNTVYTFNDEVNGNFNKAFNLEQLQKGNYEVIVNTKDFSEAYAVNL